MEIADFEKNIFFWLEYGDCFWMENETEIKSDIYEFRQNHHIGERDEIITHIIMSPYFDL